MWVSSPLLVTVHVSKGNNGSAVIPLEIVPNWDQAWKTWKWAWETHVYGLALLFYLTSAFCATSCYRFRKRLLKKKPFGVSLALIFALGASRGTYLVLDPYGSRHLTPEIVRRILFDLAYPCITTAFSLIQLIILKVTKVDVGPTRLQSNKFLLTVTLSYFLSLPAIESLVGVTRDLKLLLLIPHGYFIVWSIYLCITFIYNGFKLTHYVAEIQKARKELSSYSVAKRSCSSDNMSRSVTIQRLTKPQIRITDEDNQTYSIVSDEESTVSELNELAIFNVVSSIEQASKNNHVDSKEALLGDTSFENTSRWIDETTLGPNSREMYEIKPSENCSANRDRANSACSLLCRSNEKQDDRADSDTEAEAAPWRRLSAFLSPSDADFDESLLVDNGYMADTEFTATVKSARKTKQKARKFSVVSESRDMDGDSNSEWQPHLLTCSQSTLSLHRIRQSQMLQKVMRFTYLTTFLAVVACLFQLYAIFGIYGIFSRMVDPDPWPWLVFHSFFRLTEFGMGAAMASVIHLIIRHKNRTSTNKKARYKLLQTFVSLW